jgi:hypothetical protein
VTPETGLPSATERLEIALDSIAQAAAAAMIRSGRGEGNPAADHGAPSGAPEIAARLDELIARVRAALDDA